MIIKACESDLVEIVGLIIQMYREGGYDSILRNDAETFILQAYLDMYNNQQAQHFLIKSELKIVSCAGAFIKTDMLSTFRKMPYFGFISNVYTIPEHRNQGYATLLTKRSIDWLKENGIRDIKLVSTENSRKIYERIGFKPTDEMILALED